MKKLGLVLLLWAWPLPALAASVTIAAFGDSLMTGYGLQQNESFPRLLEAKLRANGYDVAILNNGVNGDTTAGGVGRVDLILAQRPDMVILELGGNDILRRIPPAQTRSNLEAILVKLKQANVSVLMLGQQAPLLAGAEYANAHNAIYPELAAAYGTGLFPYFLQGVYGTPGMMQADGVHPTRAGIDVMVDNIYPLVANALPK